LLSGCPGHRQRPPGPAPEYERPVVMPWDAGPPHDPLDDVKGEDVPDDEPMDAAPTAPTAPVADAGSAPLEPPLPEE
jgi:hypothetical protein